MLKDILRSLESNRPTLIVLSRDDADKTHSELDTIGRAYEEGTTGRLTQWRIRGVPVAVADVRRSYVLYEEGDGHPIIQMLV